MYRLLILMAIGITGFQISLHAQEFEFTKPTWWMGGAQGINFNDYRGTTQKLNSNLTIPAAFHHGNGAGLYIAPLVEFHRPNAKWGAMLQAGYDSRKGSFKQITTPCNCPSDLSANISYLTVEPSLRYAPFRSNFHLFAGPRLAYNLMNTFIYKQKPNPEFPEQESIPDVKGNFSKTNKTLLSMQIGAGYDIPLTSKSKYEQAVLSPFVSFQPYFGQSPRSIETWSLTTLRIGVALKFGRGRKIIAPSQTVNFSVYSPANMAIKNKVSQTFPLSNNIFFNEQSTAIPDRYSLLTKEQVNHFKNAPMEVFIPKVLSDWYAQEMIVYYNVLNILGARMANNSSSAITLVGSSRNGKEEGKIMAESVKQYLTTVYDIDVNRINVEGRDKPKIPSEQRTGNYQSDLLRDSDDRRVSIESNSPALLMEFQSGSDATQLPMERVQEAPIESYVSFCVDGGTEVLASWSLEVINENNETQKFGPYELEEMSMPGKSILGERPEGDYKMKMIGQAKNGKIITKETKVHMVLWTPPKAEAGVRHNILFDFNESKVLGSYEKYLTEIVAPLLPKDATVVIRGHADSIGDERHNLTLSMDRANEVMNIIGKALSKANRSDVTFEVYGHGEDQGMSPFQNTFPEERFYNRTVLIDILPSEVKLISYIPGIK